MIIILLELLNHKMSIKLKLHLSLVTFFGTCCLMVDFVNAQNKMPCYNMAEYHEVKYKDTIVIPYWVVEYVKKNHESYGEPRRFYIDKQEVDSLTYRRIKSMINSAFKFLDSSSWHYCRFYYENGNMVQEGVSGNELFFIGKIKSYHQNGIIAEEGSYSDNFCYRNKKVGLWKYYNEQGKLIKEEMYNDKGILQKPKKAKAPIKKENVKAK